MFWLILAILAVLWFVPMKVLAFAAVAITTVLVVTSIYLAFYVAVVWLLHRIDKFFD